LLFRCGNLTATVTFRPQPIWNRFHIWRAVPGHGRTPRGLVARKVLTRSLVAALEISLFGNVGSRGVPWLLAGKVGGAQVLTALAHQRASFL
jgi:hypothetical protein